MLVCYSFSIAQPEHCEVVLQSEGKKPIRTSCAGTRNPFPSPEQARGGLRALQHAAFLWLRNTQVHPP